MIMSFFEELHLSIYHSLGEMIKNKCESRYNKETAAKADSLFKLVTDFIYIIKLLIIKNVSDYLLSVTKRLSKQGLRQSTINWID